MVSSGQSMTAGCACDAAILRPPASRSMGMAEKSALHLRELVYVVYVF